MTAGAASGARRGSRCILLLAALMGLAPCRTTPAIPAPADVPGLERIRAFVFPKSIAYDARTRAFEYRDRGYRFQSLEEVNVFNVAGAHPIPGSEQFLELRYMPLESPYRASLRAGQGADAFIDALHDILSATGRETGSRTQRLRGGTIHKLLAQRDLYQAYSLAFLAREHVDASRRDAADGVLDSLAHRIASTLFTPEEYRALLDSRPRSLPARFASSPAYSLEQDYLPAVVLRADSSWTRLTNRGEPFRHFSDYRARSIVNVYVRAAGRSVPQIQALHAQLFGKYGLTLHQTAIKEEVPDGFETLLVRNIGVLLSDGTYRDSSWPEEVIMRVFKYPKPKLDLETSDFSGTLFYQYKLARELAEGNAGSLGLVRVRDDDAQFYGFFGDVPDPHNSYSRSVTTMRQNCVACHAELFYGLNTVFSFERDPQFESQADANEFWKPVGDGAYALLTLEHASLVERLRGISASENR
jgi:hypothetical protein